ncbi:MAG: GIY-YIG nuclease family protein [Candidatus Moranbacteria bacterium]|nr:GIY-YIG nuclease family protein [Candidatus Moranbacteria bacterium]
MYYVYLLKNECDEFYYGCTSDLKKRLVEHNTDKSFSTKGHRWKVLYYEAYFSSKDAFLREKQLKQYGQSLSHLKRRLKYSLNEN